MESNTTAARNRRICKKCSQGVLDSRARRPALVKLLFFWLPIRRYKCNYCDRKTYVYGSIWHNVKQNNLQMN